MLYLVNNEFDERPRLVCADSEEEAIIKAKASVTPQELEEKRQRERESVIRINETWDNLVKLDQSTRELYAKQGRECTLPPMGERIRLDPEECKYYTVEDYVWCVSQVIDPAAEVTVLDNVCEC